MALRTEEIKYYRGEAVRVLSRYDIKSGRWTLVEDVRRERLRAVWDAELRDDPRPRAEDFCRRTP